MSEIPLTVSYDNSNGRLVIELDSKQPSHEPESILEWLSEKGLPNDPPIFHSALREKLTREQKVIEGEIQNLCRTLQRKALEVRAYKYIVAPIRMIPQEVLRRILTFMAPDIFQSWKILKPLMEVCRIWRSTIYDMPLMWEDITVTGEGREEEWLALQLPKAKVTRLNIDWQPQEESTALMEAVLSRCELWRTICFRVSDLEEVDSSKLLRDALRKAGSLIEITWFGYDSPDLIQSNEAAINLPSVRSLTLDSNAKLPAFILPNLTDLRLTRVDIPSEEFQTLPHLFPCLRSIRDTASSFSDDEGSEVLRNLIASPSNFQALEVLQVFETESYSTPLWLAVAPGAANLKTLLLTSAVIRRYRNLRTFEAVWMQHVRSLIIVVARKDINWEYDKLFRLFTGVQDLELRPKESNAAYTSIEYFLDGTSCTSNEPHALFPKLNRLSVSFNYSSKENLSRSVSDLLHSLAEARYLWYCPVSLQMEDGIIFLDMTAEEFGSLLADFENSWPVVHDAIHKNVPFC